jgi:YARHG domain/WG containing repeat
MLSNNTNKIASNIHIICINLFLILILSTVIHSELAKAYEAIVLFLVEQDSKYGYIDKTGKIVIEPQFEDAEDFSEGLASIKIDGKYGYIDKTGKIIIESQFDMAVKFSEGLGRVGYGRDLSSKRQGFINKSGKFVINPVFEAASDFSEGWAGVILNEKSYLIDKSGNYFNNRPLNTIWGFSEGLIAVKIGDKWGYMDKSGNIVIAPQFKWAYKFSNGLARVWKSLLDKNYFIDKNGTIIINGPFDNASNYSENLAAVKVGNKWGYINREEQIVINPQFDWAEPFSNGLAEVKIDDKYVYINKEGEVIPVISNYSDSSSLSSADYITQWLFPDSDKRFFTDDDVKNLSKEDLWIARNEIFARHGYIFKTPKGKAYVETLDPVYKGIIFDAGKIILNEFEKANIDLIKKYENK